MSGTSCFLWFQAILIGAHSSGIVEFSGTAELLSLYSEPIFFSNNYFFLLSIWISNIASPAFLLLVFACYTLFLSIYFQTLHVFMFILTYK